MDPFEALGVEARRELADHRDTLPRAYLYGPHAVSELASALAEETRGRIAVVVSDRRTRLAAGAECIAALESAGWRVIEASLPDDGRGGSPVCDEPTKAWLEAEAAACDALVAVGAGVVNDLTKWVAAERSVPYAVCATAASMNGYAAANVAPTIQGVKSLLRARAPRVIAASPRVVENAPSRLTAAGLGDLVAKPVSTADWLLNHRLFGEPYSQAVASIIAEVEPRYLDRPERVAARDPDAIRALFDALVLSGCAMTLQGSSLPASGGEHLVSHTLDMMAGLDGSEHDLHGRQVGVATILAAALWERAMQAPEPRFRARAVAFDARVWGGARGGVAVAVEQEHRKKVEQVRTAAERLSVPGVWDDICASLRGVLIGPAQVKECLRRAGAAHRLRDIGCSRERFLVAVRNCGAIRGRFTSIDLGYSLGILPDEAEAIVDAWLIA